MDIATITPMAWLVACQYLLYAAGWGVCGAILRAQRGPALHWAAFMLLLGLGFVLVTERGADRGFWAYVGSSVMFLASFVALRRGLEQFFGQAPREREHLAVLLVGVGALLALGPGEAHAPWRVMVSYGGIAWVLVRIVQTSHQAMQREFGRVVAYAQGAPGLGLALLFGGRALRQALDLGTPLEMHRVNFDNIGVFYAYMVGAAVFNLSFLSLMLLRMVRRLHHLSHHDPLTGLLNRRALEDALQREWQRLRRHQAPFSVVTLDLDHFKRVNDRLGHQAGDLVLQQAGQRFAATARQSDLVARAGGEEFTVLLPGTDLAGARRAAERLLARLREQPVDLPSQCLPVTASAGVAEACASDADVAAVLARADAALYRAKAQGRDQVVLDTSGLNPDDVSTVMALPAALTQA